MALFVPFGKKLVVVLGISLLLLSTALSSLDNVEEGVLSFSQGVLPDVKHSVTAHPETYLSYYEDGNVALWGRKSDMHIWTHYTGGPMASFHWFARENSDDEVGEWLVEGPEISFEVDGSLSVRDSLNRTKTLKVTLEDLRQGSPYVREGEIIQVDHATRILLLDSVTGDLIREVGNAKTNGLGVEQERESLCIIRTDYMARASNLSGAPLWSLSYGEIGTLVTGLKNPSTDVASLSLLPRISTTSLQVPYRIAPPMTQPQAIGQTHPIATYLKGQNLPSDSLALLPSPTVLPPPALLPSPAPPSLPLPRPALAIWENYEYNSASYTPAPPMLGSPTPATPQSRIVYTTVIGLAVLVVFGAFFRISSSTKAPSTPPKKRKGRKGLSSQPVVLPVTVEGSNSTSRAARMNLQARFGSGTQVGRLFVTDVMIGAGSNGTLVLEGYLDDRKVAVKRLLAQYYEKAQKEIALLIASDEHPNVVRYYATEETTDFVYVSLERCSFSLYDLILAQTSQGSSVEKQVEECLAGKGLKLRSVEDFKLWDEKGRPSPQLFQIMRDIVAGLSHLHAVGIVHRDLKPHNVLISSGRIMQAKIADMGLSKQLDDDALSYDAQITGHGGSGSRGWQAPEQLLKARGSRAVDIFSLGCVLHHCITGGKHPFGSYLERDGNIVCGKMDLFSVHDLPDAADLIERLLDHEPSKRPPAQDILLHPFFWDPEKSLSFLKDASDRVELDMKSSNSVLLADLESLGPSILCGGWGGKVDLPLLENIRGYRRYNFKSVRDLLRVIRNKANHFRELPENLQVLVGPLPDGLEDYFRSRFPRLLIEIYQVIGYHCKGEADFEKYYSTSYVPKYPCLES